MEASYTADFLAYIPHEADFAQNVLGVDDVLGHRVDLLDSNPLALVHNERAMRRMCTYSMVRRRSWTFERYKRCKISKVICRF